MIERVLHMLREDIPAYVKNRDKKPILTQIREMAALYREYRYLPYQYLNQSIYADSFQDDPLDYMPSIFVHRYCEEVNPKESRHIVLNKNTFYHLMNAVNVDVFAHLFSITCKGGISSIDGEALGFDDLIHTLRESKYRQFMFKPNEGMAGSGILGATLEDRTLTIGGETINDMESLLSILFSGNDYDDYILQPRFIQHELLDRLNPASLNTIRIDTLVQEDTVKNSGAFLRTSRGRLNVDSVSRGGLIIPIDLKTGTLDEIAHQWCKFGDDTFQEHPITKFRFKDTVLPFWPEILDLVCTAAPFLKPLKSIGWDVAIGPDGPVIIEANADHVISTLQIAAGGLRHTAIGEAALQAWGLSKSA